MNIETNSYNAGYTDAVTGREAVYSRTESQRYAKGYTRGTEITVAKANDALNALDSQYRTIIEENQLLASQLARAKSERNMWHRTAISMGAVALLFLIALVLPV